MKKRTPRPGQNYSEYVREGIPPGPECEGCEYDISGWCCLFDYPTDHGKPSWCKENKWLQGIE